MKDSYTIEDLNAARVLQGYVWKKSPHKRLKLKINRENKIEIEQTEILELLMEFTQWQKDELERLNKMSVQANEA